MEDFLRQNYIYLTHLVEFIAALTGLILLKKYKKTKTIYFIWFLVALFLLELLGRYVFLIQEDKILSFLKGTVLEKNRWLSTLRWKIGAIMFYSYYFQEILSEIRFKKTLKYTRYLFLGFSILYIAFNWDDFFIISFPIMSVLGAVIIFMSTTFYFIEVLKGDHIIEFYKSINFYISTTIFIWWLIITPLVFYDIYFINVDWEFVILKWQIYLFSNIFMYITFAIGLVVSKPKTD